MTRIQAKIHKILEQLGFTINIEVCPHQGTEELIVAGDVETTVLVYPDGGFWMSVHSLRVHEAFVAENIKGANIPKIGNLK